MFGPGAVGASRPRCPQGDGYNLRSVIRYLAMTRFPRLPPQLERLFVDAPVYFITSARIGGVLCWPRPKCTLRSCSSPKRLPGSQCRGRPLCDFARPFSPLVSGDPVFDLGRWVGQLKQVLAMCVRGQDDSDPFWQRGFFDHVLRSDESYRQKWEYVRDNPAGKAGSRRGRVAVCRRDRHHRSRLTQVAADSRRW